MGRQQELDRLWSLINKCSAEMQSEARSKKGEISEHYRSLKRDMEKLKAEYEKVNGKGTVNPMNADQMENLTQKKIYGDIMGRTGEDTHHGPGSR